MNQKCFELVDILRQELQIYRKIVELSDEETRRIVESDLERLGEIIEEIEALTETGANLSYRRVVVTGELLAELGRQGEELNLAAVAEIAGDPLKTAYESYRAETQNIARRLRRTNKNNTELLRASLSFIDGFFRELTKLASAERGYTVEGRSGSDHHWNLLDTQV